MVVRATVLWWRPLVSFSFLKGLCVCFADFCVVTKLITQQRKLEAEEEAAGEELIRLHSNLADLQSQLSTAVNRLARIRKTRNRVKEKSSELFKRGVAELDKEDGIDLTPALDAHERYVVEDLQFLGVPEEPDWSALGLGDFADLGPLHPNGASSSSTDLVS